jgi:hypothetical protein
MEALSIKLNMKGMMHLAGRKREKNIQTYKLQGLQGLPSEPPAPTMYNLRLWNLIVA